MAVIDATYHQLISIILNDGYTYSDPNRTGVTRLQIPSYRLEHDLTTSFPAIATKKLAWKSVVTELIWFLQGDSNIKYLVDNGVSIWNKDAYAHYLKKIKEFQTRPNIAAMETFIELVKTEVESNAIPNYTYGDLGPVYGHLWRNWPVGGGLKLDQILDLVFNMQHNPMSTELKVTAWNPGLKSQQALPPCHTGFQVMMRPLTYSERYDLMVRNTKNIGVTYDSQDFDVAGIPKYGFELIWEQRSVDTFLGLPFNIASYALLAHVLGKLTNSVPLKLIGDLRNVHLYDNSIKAAKEQLTRDTDIHGNVKLLMKDEFHYACEDWQNNTHGIIEKLRPDMFKLYNYKPEAGIKVEMLERT